MVLASSAHTTLDVYRQRKPRDSAYYRCVEDCFETLEQVYQDRFEQKSGYDHAAEQMATYRIQRILWATHFAPARKIHGLRLVEPTPRRETLARGTCPP